MNATWFQGSVDEFMRVSEEGYQRGGRSLHFLGGSTIDVAGTRAIAQTKITITLVPRTRSSHTIAASSAANFGFKAALES